MSFKRDILLIILGFMWMNKDSTALLGKRPNFPNIMKLLKTLGETVIHNLPIFPEVPKIVTNTVEKLVFSNKCLADLGCFFTGPPFYDPLFRPLSISPFDLKDMKTKFWLFTPRTPPDNKVGTLIAANGESFNKSGFEEDLTVKFLIHGFLTDLKDKENDDRYVLKNKLLKEGAYNVIIVDWTASNGNPYAQAVANARVVGAQVAQLIKFLQKEAGIDPKDVHLIGHSLGAHVSGWAGERIPKLGRISGVIYKVRRVIAQNKPSQLKMRGLDPAGPYFRFAENAIRLDDTDTDFLDVIHTNAGSTAIEGLGIEEAIGDLDFYPSGGNYQPGCPATLVNSTVVGINITVTAKAEGMFSPLTMSCNHNLAWKFYIASVDDCKCKFMGTQCKTYEKFKEGECKDGMRVVMGFHAKKNPKIPKKMKYYLDVGDHFPFCTNQKKSCNDTDVNK